MLFDISVPNREKMLLYKFEPNQEYIYRLSGDRKNASESSSRKILVVMNRVFIGEVKAPELSNLTQSGCQKNCHFWYDF